MRGMTGASGGRWFDVSKRAFDLAGAAIGLVLASPVMGVVGLLVRARLGRPVIFRQARPGLNGRVFTLYKFRTMLEPDPEHGLVTDDERVTRFGQTLRSTSLDELPTLLNVLKGDMSLVGPRPLLVHYLDRYSTEQRRRHEVKPGITGLAQVCGRNDVDWSDRLRLDVEYVDRRGWRLDLWILCRTVVAVLKRTGITSQSHVTMPEFDPPTG
jgi:lipopolysaccharide/colanic/teichoic acid biosynthesis glycosyltransferase